MSLDWFPGQKCTLKHPVGITFVAALLAIGVKVPVFGVVYTVDGAEPCDHCEAHIALRQIGEDMYPAKWFRPVDPVELQKLRELIAPKPRVRKHEVVE